MAATTLVVSFFALSSGVHGAQKMAKAADNPKARIAAVYRQLATLTIQKNMAGFSKLIKSHSTSDFHRIGMDRSKQSGAHFVQEMRRQMVMVKQIKGNKIKVDTFVLHGNQATVTASSSITAIVEDPNGSPHLVTSGDTSLDTWVRERNVWKLRSMKELREHTMLDGKPFKSPLGPKKTPTAEVKPAQLSGVRPAKAKPKPKAKLRAFQTGF